LLGLPWIFGFLAAEGWLREIGVVSADKELPLDNYSYNRYLAVAARVVRRSLKDDKRLAAERRGDMDLRFAKWTVSGAAGEGWKSGRRVTVLCLEEDAEKQWTDGKSEWSRLT